MSIEDAVNPIVDFINRLLGHHLWIVPIAISATSWLVYRIDESRWYLLYIAILFGIITVLYVLSQLYSLIANCISEHKQKKKAEEKKAKEAECARNNERRCREERATQIWKLVCHAKIDMVDAATHFLGLEVFDENKYVRYLAFPKGGDYQGSKLFDAFCQVAEYFEYPVPYSSPFSLIQLERCKEGVYFYFNEYFYSLLENYSRTKEWKKL